MFNLQHECVVCGISDSDSNLNHCSWPCCGSLYHLECSEKIKLAYKLDIKHLKKSDLCPRHFCFTCGNPARLKFKGKTEDLGKLIACFRCYRAFHECCAPKSSTFLEHTMLCAWHKTPKSTSRLELVSRLLPRHQFTEILGVEFAHVSDQQEFFFPTRWIPENYRTVHDYQYVASDEEEMEAAEFLKENSPKKIVPKDGVPKLNRASRPPKYGKLSANLYAKGTKPPVNKKFDDSSICNCSSGMQCAMDFCINRACHIECDQFCPCGPYCRNQRLQKKEYAKLKLIKTPNRGFGVITEQDLTPGDLVLEYCGEVITVEECQDRLIEMEKIGDKNYYFLALNASLILDAGRKGNIARFINHSCDPNCMTQKWTVGGVTRIGIYAKKNIRSGTELNYNYNFMGYGVDDEGQICYCGSANCPGYFSRRPLKEAKSKNPLKRKSKSKRKFSRQKSISAIQEKENLGMISTIKDHKNTNAEVESPRSKKRAVQEVSTETPTTEAENSEATDILMEDVEVQQLPNETLLKPLMLESQTDP